MNYPELLCALHPLACITVPEDEAGLPRKSLFIISSSDDPEVVCIVHEQDPQDPFIIFHRDGHCSSFLPEVIPGNEPEVFVGWEAGLFHLYVWALLSLAAFCSDQPHQWAAALPHLQHAIQALDTG